MSTVASSRRAPVSRPTHHRQRRRSHRTSAPAHRLAHRSPQRIAALAPAAFLARPRQPFPIVLMPIGRLCKVRSWSGNCPPLTTKTEPGPLPAHCQLLPINSPHHLSPMHVCPGISLTGSACPLSATPTHTHLTSNHSRFPARTGSHGHSLPPLNRTRQQSLLSLLSPASTPATALIPPITHHRRHRHHPSPKFHLDRLFRLRLA